MTTRSYICHDPAIVAIWPDDCESGVEHALVLRLYVDSIGIEQNGQRILIPMHAFGPLMTTLREMSLQAKGPR